MMHEAVDCGERHGRIWEDAVPFSEGLIGGDQRGAALVAGADQLKKDRSFRLVFADIGEIIENQQVKAVKPVDGGLERQFPTGHL